MKILRFCLSSAFIVSVSVLSNSAMAACHNDKVKKDEVGKYCLTSSKYWCPGGCYCTAKEGQYFGALDQKGNGKKDISNGQVANWCSNRDKSSCPWSAGGDQCGTSNAGNIFLCPSGYPNSPTGASSIEKCYATCSDGRTFNYKKINCSKGQYIPKGGNECKACPDDGKSYCTGATDYGPNCSGAQQDWGLKTCESGKVPNSDKTGCVTQTAPKYKCIAGEYLPANSTECAACPTGKLCLGGEWEKRAIAQGDDGECDSDKIINNKGNACVPCPTGKKANSSHTECVEGDPIKVKPGFYLPANSITPKACNNARKFCPGGEFGMLSMDQGQYDCPNGGTVSSDKKSCILTLDKKQMRCGPQGFKANSEQCISETPCWIKTDPEDYVNCIYGARFDVNEATE